MKPPVTAFQDRLLADALAFHLRAPNAFRELGNHVDVDARNEYLAKRGRIYRIELSGTEANAEVGVNFALSRLATRKTDGRIITELLQESRRLLQRDGAEIILCVERDEPGREVLRWRYISLALPSSILIAAAAGTAFVPPQRVRILQSSIGPSGPVAHQHVHDSAMMSFEALWSSLHIQAELRPWNVLAAVAEERAECPSLHDGPCPGVALGGASVRQERRRAEHGRHMKQWATLLLKAFAARRILTAHVQHTGPLKTCSFEPCQTTLNALSTFAAGRINEHDPISTILSRSAYGVGLGKRLHRATRFIPPGRREYREDLLSNLSIEEHGFLANCFAYLESSELPVTTPAKRELGPDPVFEKLFLQYLRIKTALYRLVVHGPGEHGLQAFLRHFKQIKIYTPHEQLLHREPDYEPGLDIEHIERRIAPDAWPVASERRDQSRARQLGIAMNRCETVWLIHFQRSRRSKGVPIYGVDINAIKINGASIVRALRAKPTRLKKLRGIDLCGAESDQPLWVAAETLRHVRLESSRIAAQNPRLGLKPLRLTLHAGEGFEWLTSGVRAVAEPFVWKLIERGDRIGHAIAITLIAKEWWKRNKGRVFDVTQLDRLLDLAFLAKYTDATRSLEDGRWLLTEITEALMRMGFQHDGKTDVVQETIEFWQALGGRPMRHIIETQPWGATDNGHVRWMRQYAWDRSAHDRAEKKIRIRVSDDRGSNRHITVRKTELRLLTLAQSRLIEEVARWQTVIETNPSSNLIVGGLDAFGAAQDFLQTRPTLRGGQKDNEWTLPWTISTDDPLTFATSLADEYAYAWAGMVLRDDGGYDPSYARALLDEAAATSIRTRF